MEKSLKTIMMKKKLLKIAIEKEDEKRTEEQLNDLIRFSKNIIEDGLDLKAFTPYYFNYK